MTPQDNSSASAQKWPDLAGRLEGERGNRRHVLPVRVYFEDTDFSGLVYHASYIRWCERGRSDFLRLIGNDHRGLIEGAERILSPITIAKRRPLLALVTSKNLRAPSSVRSKLTMRCKFSVS